MRQILFLAVVLCLSTVASAFPLHGGNDQMNATVYGVIWDHPGEVLVDVSLAHVVPSDTYLNARLDLVDSGDKFYSPDESSGAGNGDLMDFSPDATGYRAITRALVPFKVPGCYHQAVAVQSSVVAAVFHRLERRPPSVGQ